MPEGFSKWAHQYPCGELQICSNNNITLERSTQDYQCPLPPSQITDVAARGIDVPEADVVIQGTRTFNRFIVYHRS